jgi:ABC-type multidrug transport system ATPase subunit
LVSGDRIDIGPFELTFDGTALTRVWRVGNVELLVRGVSYDVPGGVSQRILHDANLRIRPSELVAIGANGSGKSTLMNIMAGRVLPSVGNVLLNDGDLHANRNQPQYPSHPRSPAGYRPDRAYLSCRHPPILWTLPS